MNPIRSVLAATDFSPDSRHAAKRAALVAATVGLERATLLHVIEGSWLELWRRFQGTSTNVEAQLMADAARSLAEMGRRIGKGTFAMAPEVRVGKAVDVIAEMATSFDLLALGARGRHKLRALTLGTTSQRLLGKTGLPVLVVRRPPEATYRRVLIGADFSPHSFKAVAYGRAIGPGADLRLTHVFEPLYEGHLRWAGVSEQMLEDYREEVRQSAEGEMKQFLMSLGSGPDEVRWSLEHGRPAAVLRKKARKWPADLVVVGRRGKSIVEDFLLGSVTLHLLAESQCDVLVVQ